MKKILAATAICMALVQCAHAAESVDLKVKGNLTTGSCTPSLDNNGVIDLGKIPVKSLVEEGASGSGRIKLAKHMDYGFDITCTSNAKVGFSITDNKPDTVPAEFSSYKGMYGFGTTSDSDKIGAFQIYKKTATIDGVTSEALYSANSMATWNKGTSSLDATTSGIVSYFSWGKSGESTPAEGKVFHLIMDTAFYFSKATVDKVVDDLPFSGSATFTMVYL